MLFLEFKQQFSKYKVFSSKEIEKLFPNFNKMNLLTWQKKGYLLKLRNSWYCFNEMKTDEATLFYTANKIYNPSYVSLETALFYYGVIPEAVFLIRSVSTLKTNEFKNNHRFFTYTNIKSNCFFGYKFINNENFTFKIAEIEKALLDFLYIHYSIKTLNDINSLRLNKQLLKEKLNFQKLLDYTKLYNSKILFKKVKLLNQYLND